MPRIQSQQPSILPFILPEDICVHFFPSDILPQQTEFNMDRPRRQKIRHEQASILFNCKNINRTDFGIVNDNAIGQFISSIYDMREYIKCQFLEMHDILKVHCKLEENIFYTWIAIEERDLELRQQIYQIEDEIIKKFPEYEFDFYTIYASGRNPESFFGEEPSVMG